MCSSDLTHLSNLSRARAGAAAHDGAVGRSNALDVGNMSGNHGQGEPGSSLPLLPAVLPEDAADSSRAGSECSGLQSEVIDNSSDGELGSEDLRDSVGNGPEIFQ